MEHFKSAAVHDGAFLDFFPYVSKKHCKFSSLLSDRLSSVADLYRIYQRFAHRFDRQPAFAAAGKISHGNFCDGQSIYSYREFFLFVGGVRGYADRFSDKDPAAGADGAGDSAAAVSFFSGFVLDSIGGVRFFRRSETSVYGGADVPGFFILQKNWED